MISKQIGKTMLFIIFFILLSLTASAADFKDWPQSFANVPYNKEWTITFSDKFDPTTLTSDNIQIANDQGEIHPTKIMISGDKEITVSPLENYQTGTYYLTISNNVMSHKKRFLYEGIIMTFSAIGEEPIPEEPPVDDKDIIPEVLNSTLVTTTRTYPATVTKNSDTTLITYDMRAEPNTSTFVSGSMEVNKNSTLTITKLPQIIEYFVSVGRSEDFSQGNNSMSLVKKMADTGIDFDLLRIIGNFEVEAELIDEHGNNEKILLHFVVK